MRLPLLLLDMILTVFGAVQRFHLMHLLMIFSILNSVKTKYSQA